MDAVALRLGSLLHALPHVRVAAFQTSPAVQLHVVPLVRPTVVEPVTAEQLRVQVVLLENHTVLGRQLQRAMFVLGLVALTNVTLSHLSQQRKSIAFQV